MSYVRGKLTYIPRCKHKLPRWPRLFHSIVLPEHVLETSDPNDMTFASLLSALGSSEAAMLWREMRLVGGAGVAAKPKTWFVLPDINY